MERRTTFAGWALPASLVLPQLLLTFFFFLLPAGQAIVYSVQHQDPFGLNSSFAGLDNFIDLFEDPLYLAAARRTVFFCSVVAVLSMSLALLLAVFADRGVRGQSVYRTLLIWPYAVAPAIAAVVWILLLHPHVGVVGNWLAAAGIDWDYKLNETQAMAVVIFASVWKQISYNFIFYLAGLQAISPAVNEAARMDGAKGFYRFRTITFPLLAPTTFFLIVVNVVYAAFDTFATILAMTAGGPGQATTTLIVQVYRDGVINLNLGSSSAQSVVLMVAVMALTVVQFRFMGQRNNA